MSIFRLQTFGNIPKGIAITAGLLNKIEVGLIEIFDTSDLYKDTVGGRGLEALLSLYTGVGVADSQLDMSLDRYIQDCVSVEVGRPDPNIDFSKLRNGTTDFTTFFSSSANPALYTLTYIDDAKGAEVTCSQAWTKINTKVSADATFNKILKNACLRVGFSDNSPSINACTQMLSKYIYFLTNTSSYGSGTYDALQFARKLYYTRRIDEYAREGMLSPYGNYNIGIQNIGSQTLLNQWIPYIKSVLTALVFSITPLLLVFLPTPLFGRVFSLMFGFYIWLMFWSVADAIVHNAIGSLIQNTFESFRSKIASGGDIGFDSLLTLPDPASKSLVVLGYVRTGAISLATVLTGVLVKFGSHTLAEFAGNITGNISSAGAKAAHDTVHAVGSAQTVQAATQAWATHRWTANYSFDERGGGAYGNMAWGTSVGMGFAGHSVSELKRAGGATATGQVIDGLAKDQLQRAYTKEDLVNTSAAKLKIDAGTTLEAGKLLGGMDRFVKGSINSNAAQQASTAKLGLQYDSQGLFDADMTRKVEDTEKWLTLYRSGGVAAAKERGLTGALKHQAEYLTGPEAKAKVLSQAAGKPQGVDDVMNLTAQGGSVFVFSDGSGFVNLGIGAGVYTDPNRGNFAILDSKSSRVMANIQEAAQYRQTLSALQKTESGQRFLNNLQNKWSDSKSGEYSTRAGETFRNAFEQSFKEALSKNNELMKQLGFTHEDLARSQMTFSFGGDGSAGINLEKGPNAGVSLKIGANGELMSASQYGVKSGVTSSVKLDSQSVNAIQTAYQQSREKGWQQVMSDRSGYEYVLTKGKESSASEAKAVQNAAESSKLWSQRLDYDTTNQIFHNYVLGKYGVVNTETVAKAQSDVQQMGAMGDYSDVWKYVSKPVQGADPVTVQEKIDNTKASIDRDSNKLKNIQLHVPRGNPSSALRVDPEVLTIFRPDFSGVKKERENFEKYQQYTNQNLDDLNPKGLILRDIVVQTPVVQGVYSLFGGKSASDMIHDKFKTFKW
jgi:hypothetical protein